MLKDVPISPRIQPIRNHYEIAQTTCNYEIAQTTSNYEIAQTTCKPSSWSLQHHHKLILTFRVFF